MFVITVRFKKSSALLVHKKARDLIKYHHMAIRINLVDISGIDKDILLKALWEYSKPASFFSVSHTLPPGFELVKAKQELHYGYADYICGRLIKTNIYESDLVDPLMYDRHTSPGTLASIVEKLRKNQ